MLKILSLGLALLLVSGCASYGVVDNTPQKTVAAPDGYSIRSGGGRGWGSGEIGLVLAFSGGGTRAAALAYGVLEELRDTTVVIDGKPRRLLDETDIISSVSGGSFTSAYYGLYGDRIFDDFEDVFLRRNVQRQLIRGLLNPLEWFSSAGRTEPEMDVSNKQPSLKETIGAMSDVQLHRYNVATLELMDKSVKRWARDLSTPGRPVTPYFIQVGFRDFAQPEQLQFFNRVPTSFSLSDEQVDKLIAAGRELLRNNPDFQRFLAGLGGARAAGG